MKSLEIKFDLYDLPEDTVDELFNYMFNDIITNIGSGGINICLKSFDRNLFVSFVDMVNQNADFWDANDPEWTAHNLKNMKAELALAAAKIDEIIAGYG